MVGQIFFDDVPDFVVGYAGAMCGTGARGQRVMARAVSATRPASRATTDFERIFPGNVIAVLYIVSSLRKLQWLLRRTKNWSGKHFFQIE